MKNIVFSLLLHLGSHVFSAAATPTLVAADPSAYKAAVPDPSPTPAPDNMWASYDDGFTLFLGEDVSTSVKAILNSNCSNPADAVCVSSLIDALGAMPAVASLEKRGMAFSMAAAIGKLTKGPFLPLAVAAELPYLWNWLQEDEKKYSIISIKIPAPQTSEIADMSIGFDGVFEYASMTGAPGAVITAAAQPSAAPDFIPTLSKADNGDYNVHLQEDFAANVKAIIESTTCKRELNTKRELGTLTARDLADCVAIAGEGIVNAAQDGGSLGASIFIAATVAWPVARNADLVRALTQVRNYGRTCFFFAAGIAGDGLTAAVDAVSEWATWLAWLDLSAGLDIAADMEISATLAEDQNPDEEEGSDCPDEDLQPFCSNCGGDAGGGKCVGHPKGGYKDCPCFVDEALEYGPVWPATTYTSFQTLLDLPNFELPSEEGHPGLQCSPQTNNGWVQASKVSDWAPGYCSSKKTPSDEFFVEENEFTAVHLKQDFDDPDEPNDVCVAAYQLIIDACSGGSFPDGTEFGGTYTDLNTGIEYGFSGLHPVSELTVAPKPADFNCDCGESGCSKDSMPCCASGSCVCHCTESGCADEDPTCCASGTCAPLPSRKMSRSIMF